MANSSFCQTAAYPKPVDIKTHKELPDFFAQRGGVVLLDVVNAIPYVAMQKGLLTNDKQNKLNVFSGRIMEIEGLPDLKVEQAFELTDATAERSCAGSMIKLSEATVTEYIRSNVSLLKNIVARGYGDPRTILRRVAQMEAWLANPVLMSADADAEYAEIIEIDYFL
jgi:aconitate hydratase 2 / 2-methylisocitrate dehydratase